MEALLTEKPIFDMFYFLGIGAHTKTLIPGPILRM